MYQVCQLQNHEDVDKATIIIRENDPRWEKAIGRWREGVCPTDDKEWKLGIIASTRLVDADEKGGRV